MNAKTRSCVVFKVILVLCLLCCFSTATGEVENYDYTYETAISLAGNDLSNINNLKDATTMLDQIGTYKLSRSYLIYFQQFVEIQSAHPDFATAILMFELCNDMEPFVQDLEARGLPSCADIIAYAKARILEEEGKLNEACAAFRKMVIMDAPDRAMNLAIKIAKATPTPTMIEPASTPTPTPKPTNTPTPKPTQTPEPTDAPISITKVSYLGGGKIEVAYDGSAPSEVSIQHYFNAEYNKDISVSYYREDMMAKTNWSRKCVEFSRLIPGQRYWIHLVDKHGHHVWYDYTIPDLDSLSYQISLSGISVTKNNYKKRVNQYSAKELAKACTQEEGYFGDYGIAPQVKVSKLTETTYSDFVWAYIMPNGDITMSHESCWYFERNGSYTLSNSEWTDGWLWYSIYESYGYIPTGTYKFLLCVDDHVVGTKEFKVVE